MLFLKNFRIKKYLKVFKKYILCILNSFNLFLNFKYFWFICNNNKKSSNFKTYQSFNKKNFNSIDFTVLGLCCFI